MHHIFTFPRVNRRAEKKIGQLSKVSENQDFQIVSEFRTVYVSLRSTTYNIIYNTFDDTKVFTMVNSHTRVVMMRRKTSKVSEILVRTVKVEVVYINRYLNNV